MKKRGDTDNIVENRLKAVEQELEYSQKCNYIIVNDDFRIAYDDLKSIARAETLKNEA
jgi:guanylate kinase